jgi:hypothetical protein
MSAALGAVVWLVAASAQPVTVEGSACLEAADLERALDGLVADGGERAPVAVELAAGPEALVVRVRSEGGAVLAERALPPLVAPDASCKERAQEIAVVVAAAVGTPDGPGPLAVPAPAPPPAAGSAPAASPPPAASSPATGSSPAAAPPPPPVAARARLERAPPAPPPLEVGFAVGTALAAGSFAPAARLQATLWLREPLGLRLVALYDGEHDEQVGGGQAVWTRAGLGAALAARQPLGRGLALEASATLAAAMRTIAGRGFAAADTSHTFDPGAGVGLGLSWHGRRFGLSAGADAAIWPRTQGVFVRNADVRADLAAFDLFFGVGLSLSPDSPVTLLPDPT